MNCPEYRLIAARKQREKKHNNPYLYLRATFQTTKNRAISKLKCEFNLTHEHLMWLFEKQGGLCYYSGLKMTFITSNGKVDTNVSIDRIEPNKGYIIGNVVLCCYYINVSKRDKSLDEWLRWSDMVKQNQYFLNLKTA